MLRGLNARLLISYILIILVCLALVAVGLFLFIRTSPLWSRVGVAPLDPAVQALRVNLARTGPPENRTTEGLRDLLTQVSEEEDVRSLLLDNSGRMIFDSEGAWTGRDLPVLVMRRVVRPTTSQGTFTAPDGRRWIFFSEPIPTGGGRDLFADFVALWPDRFISVTNGVTQRRWMLKANPAMSRLIRPTTAQGTFTAPDGRRWIFFSEPIPIGDRRELFAVFVAPYARWLPFLWFVDNFFPPLLRAGGIALVLSALMAWLLARSVARPLRRVAAAATALAQGDLSQRAPISGPQEVRDVAQSFNHMADEVTAVQQSQRDLVANVSHELKTPLTSIQGFSQAILDGTAAEPAAVDRAATIIFDEAERMRRMVTALLDLARFDAGQVDIAREPVDLQALIRRCVERLAPQAEAAGNRLTHSIPEDLVVVGDADWLTQIFVNLIDNAIGHTGDGKIEITARRDGDWVEVAITDTGEGIPPEDLSRIFERFYRADKSRRRQTGVGLGLSIAREAVRLHGGDIVVESVVGLGSRFNVRFPAQS